MSTTLQRLLLLVAIVFLANIDQNSGLPTPGKQESKRTSQFKHLRQQFDIFKRQLDQLIADSSNDETLVAGTQQVVEDSATELEKRCAECDEGSSSSSSSSSSSLEKRCPSGCGSKKKKPQNTETKVNGPAATGLEKRCAECDESSYAVEKRCPSGCGGSKTKTPPPSPKTEEEEGTATKESSMMKRFLNALPDEDKRLIEGSQAKRQYIERLIGRTHHGPNANDVAADKARAEERMNAISNIGVRSMPAEDSGLMLSFKRGLSASDQQLLRKYKSKTRFIEGVLEKQTANGDKRDLDVPEKKRQFEDPVVSKYVSGLDEDQKALIQRHPSIAGHLKEAILKGTREGQEEKRELSPDQIQNVPNKLNSKDEDAELVKQRLSKIEKVAAAEALPVGNPDEEIEQVVSRLMTDIKMAKKRGFSLNKLFSEMKKKASEEHK